MRFYYTYGLDTDIQPFRGGWTKVIASDRLAADRAFLARHPKTDGYIPCAFVYGEEFERSKMYEVGNFGSKCHEVIEA